MRKQNLIQGGLVRPVTGNAANTAGYIKSNRYGWQVATALLIAFLAPAAAYASQVGAVGSGRLLPALAAVAGLAGVIAGRRALVRSRSMSNGRGGAIVALITGLISLGVGGLHVANSAGGVGTGNGLAGAIVALLLGSVAVILGILAMARSQKEATKDSI